MKKLYYVIILSIFGSNFAQAAPPPKGGYDNTNGNVPSVRILCDSNTSLTGGALMGSALAPCVFSGGSSGGTVAQGTPGAATAAWFDQIVYGGALVSGTNKFPVTDTSLDALINSGALSVSVGNFPLTQAVTGTFFQATQPVSGTFFQATQPVSDALIDPLVNASGSATGNSLQVTSDSATVTGTITTQNLNPTSGTATANSTVSIAVNGQADLMIGVQGTYTATLSVQGTVDNSNWISAVGTPSIRSFATSTSNGNISSTGLFEISAGGLKQIRISALGSITGTATITLSLGTHSRLVTLDSKTTVNIVGSQGVALDATATGATAPANALQIGCKYNSTPVTLTTGQMGATACNTATSVYVDSEGLKATYSANAATTLATAATDAFQICGVASKELRIRQIALQGIATTAGEMQASIIKRSTANSAGTSSAVTSVPNDSNNTASSASILAYTANPTTGTSIGSVSSVYLPFQLAANETLPVTLTFGTRDTQSITLRSATDCVAVNLNGGTVPAGAALNASFEYTIN